MARFWVYIGDKVQGPVDIPSLRKIPGFNLLCQVCEEGAQNWRLADEVIEIKSYFLAPPRPNSLAIDPGNTAPKLDLTPKLEPEEFTLPEPNLSWQSAANKTPAKQPNLEIVMPDFTKKGEPGSSPNNALRMVCEICGYKNPRDVTVCM